MGTGDGRLPFTRARESPERLFIGVDAHAAGMRELSGRAARGRMLNVAFVRASIEALPPELAGIADRVTVVLPWGSLLAAVALPSVPALRGLRGVCQPGASLEIVLGSDPARDRAELDRLGLPSLAAGALAERVEPAYRAAGFGLGSVRALPAADVARLPATWARRLAFGGARSFVQLTARAV